MDNVAQYVNLRRRSWTERVETVFPPSFKVLRSLKITEEVTFRSFLS